RPPECSDRFLPLPDKKWTLHAAPANQALPVQQRRQSHSAKCLETDASKMALLMSTKDQTQDFLRQPAVQLSQLVFVVHVFQIIIQNSNVTQTLIDRLLGNHDQRLGSTVRVGRTFPAAPATAKSKTKNVLDLAQLVARQGDLTSSAEQQPQMAKVGGCRELPIGWYFAARNRQVGAMAVFEF